MRPETLWFVFALGAAFAGIMLVVNSFKRYKEGRDSLVGDWLKALDEWLKPKADDVWWVVAIKEFVAKVREAIGLVGMLQAKMGGKDDKPLSGGKFGAPDTRVLGLAGRVDQILGRGEFATAPLRA